MILYDQDILELVDTGVERNILVYDGDAVCGDITPRLLTLMISNAKDQNLNPVKWYIERKDEELLLLKCQDPVNTPRMYSFLGYPLSFIDMKPYLAYYDSLDGKLQDYDEQLILLECTSGGLLGSY
jgi:hypothetical protein